MNAFPFRLQRRAALALAAIAFAVVPFTGCGGSDEPAEMAAESRELVLVSSDVAAVERGAISAGVSLTGSLDPYRVVEVKAQVSGTIGSVRAQEGDRVGDGAVLATITAEGIRSQAASARAGVAAAEAQVALARRQYESAQTLYEAGAMSQIEFQSNETQLEAAQAQLEAAQAQATGAGEQASRTVVNSPISGAVSDKVVELGEAVTPGQTLFTVVNTSALELEGQVGVDQAAQISVGDPVEFRIDAYPGQTFRGTVSRIQPTADPATRQVGVFLRLDNPGNLVGGLFATGTVVSETLEEELLVPATALREADGVSYVLTVEGGVIRRRQVAVVARDPARGVVAVSGDLAAGETVIVAPTTDTVAGARVRTSGTASPARSTTDSE
ncbi:MAG: efflux RND transporter periplasmic adaptor subunit [Rhodothermales bacterium]